MRPTPVRSHPTHDDRARWLMGVRGDPHWDFRLELRPLVRSALPASRARGGATRLLHAVLRNRGAQQQLLPLAEARDVSELVPATAGRVPVLGEGAARSYTRQAALRP